MSIVCLHHQISYLKLHPHTTVICISVKYATCLILKFPLASVQASAETHGVLVYFVRLFFIGITKSNILSQRWHDAHPLRVIKLSLPAL